MTLRFRALARRLGVLWKALRSEWYRLREMLGRVR